ncbi:hypothetical protein PLEOSDRAFT_1045515, partial [Pleurotus ostreatus PC15]
MSEVHLAESFRNPFDARRNSKISLSQPHTVSGPKLVQAIRRRQFLEGHSSVGIRALRMQVHVGSLQSPAIDARLDSGADVSLMSEDFLSTLDEPPNIKEGMRMRLYQLTGSAQVLGYVRTKLLIPAASGDIVQFELEAYVVRGMRVPLLLGEDFQTAYELGVLRQASGLCKVFPRDRSYQLNTSTSNDNDWGFKARKAFTGQSFLKGKHRVRSRRQSRGPPRDAPPVLARYTTHIRPGFVANILVDGPFEGQETWLVEKLLISDECSEFTSAPTTVITASNPYIPLANPTNRPVMIRKGDV